MHYRFVLQALDRAALQVPSDGGAHGRVDQALAPPHGMVEELVRLQAFGVAAGDKSVCRNRVVVGAEARQRHPAAYPDPPAADALLPHATHDLRVVDGVTLGTGVHHRK